MKDITVASLQNSKLVVTPATWSDQINYLKKTPTGLLNMVGWYGSTHAMAQWRNDRDFLSIFEDNNTVGFDPQIDDWDPSYVAIEAEVMALVSVVVIRIENNELLNGSLGSIAEIGLALTSAALRGQVVIVSIEDNLLTTLNEPGAIAQYMMLELSLERLEKDDVLGRYLKVHRGNNLAELANMSIEIVQQQMDVGQPQINFANFLSKKERRKQNYPLRVLLGGSGGPYADVYDEMFNRKKKYLTSKYVKAGQVAKIVSEGAIAEAWKIPYGSIDKIGVALATRTLLSIEMEFKQEADLLLLPIMAEAASKAAASEIGFLLLNALTTGQDIKVFMEPFDPVDYIRYQFKDVELKSVATPKQIRVALREAGIADEILATAVLEEVRETFNLFKALKQGDLPHYNVVRNSLVGQTEAFQYAENVRRVRALVRAHLKRLHTDERFQEFFSFSDKIEA